MFYRNNKIFGGKKNTEILELQELRKQTGEKIDVHPSLKIFVYFLCSTEEKLTRDQNGRKNVVTQVTTYVTFLE